MTGSFGKPCLINIVQAKEVSAAVLGSGHWPFAALSHCQLCPVLQQDSLTLVLPCAPAHRVRGYEVLCVTHTSELYRVTGKPDVGKQHSQFGLQAYLKDICVWKK